MAVMGGEVDELREALRRLGLEVVGDGDGDGRPLAQIMWDGRTLAVAVTRASQVTGARARELVEGGAAQAELIVADRITADARVLLSAAGWSWFDLRGHVHLRGDGLLIDTAVDAGAGPSTPLRHRPLRGKAGLAVAYWLCAHPDEVLSPTVHSADLGFAPSTISTAAAALADSGLVDEDRRAVLPELFWELAGAWRPQWTWLASRPEPEDVPDAEHGTAWALTGDRVAGENGAPLGSAGAGPLELFVPGPVSITVAARRYGVAPAGAGVAAVAVAPVRQVFTGMNERRLDGWRTAPELAVALGLAGDPARGREILQDWPGQGHVWL
jgi:hypothetical protein